MREITLFIGIGVACLVGLVICGQIGRSYAEEWDNPLFALVVLPVAAAGAFIGGFLFPGHSWRWGLAPWWLQFVYMFGQRGPGNIWPIAIVFWALALLPFVALAKLGGVVKGMRKIEDKG